MKIIDIKIFGLLIITPLVFSSCEDFLDEENRSAVSVDAISTNPETFSQLIARVYEISREKTTHYDPDMYYELEDLGTDIVTRGTTISGVDEINDYVSMNATTGVFGIYWRNQYAIIAAANIVIDNAQIIEGLDEAIRTSGVGEAKFFRAWAYFNLVENFGGVPLVLSQILDRNMLEGQSFTRATEAEVYTQIVSDLDDALAKVEEDPDDFGQVSKDAVRHLMSKVLLTRSYKSFAATDDLTDAATLAEALIAKYPLVAPFSDLVDVDNQRNSEVIFSYLFGDNSVSKGWGNSRHMLYKFRYFDYPGMTRGNNYQRGLGAAPTPFFYSLFETGDERAAATFRRVIYAEEDYFIVDGSDTTDIFSKGDTALYFPEVAWDSTTIKSKSYKVINPETYFTNDGVTDVHYPMFRKFDNPGVAWIQPDQSVQGTRDMVMMRSGEAYLIAAEAYFMDGDATTAAARLTTLRSRSGLTAPVNSGDVNLDYILDERARELVGEVNRWMDLKRTGKLIDRTLAHNPHAALNNALSTKHLLRPIPQSEIDVTGGSLTQNDY